MQNNIERLGAHNTVTELCSVKQLIEMSSPNINRVPSE